MKKIIIISTVVAINLLIGIWIFVVTCCFFPTQKSAGQMTWSLTKDGIIIGCPHRNFSKFQLIDEWILQVNNPSPNENTYWRYICDTPVTINKNDVSVARFGVGSLDESTQETTFLLESLDPLTQGILSRVDLMSKYDLNEATILCMCIPSHLIVFANEGSDDNLSKHRKSYEQTAKGNYNKTWTSLVFLENDSNDSMAWEKQTFDYYSPGDAHLLCWEYSPDHQGCFLLFENYPEKCNELIYYNLAKHEVMAKVQIQGYREGFQVFSILNDRKTMMVYNEKIIEFYSLPDLTLVKTVSHPEIKIQCNAPIVATTDLRYIAYGYLKIYVLDTTKSEYFVLDNRHYNRIDLSYLAFSKDRPNDTAVAQFLYEMQQLCFFKDEHILTGLTYNGQYFQWDVDARKRIFYNDLAVIPK
jgi:hypothetical protein